ncbi:hypothetical protein LEN26_014021 [Aphanomyces euteiches]|nr:hypothetical protein AeMF1_019943 [Aphanomyces euteiches]KAH9109445.1 hypothetical protein LEN26_014021 [Aphanomyces euteiches]KAH9182728.1 hypothetical protein AeNC1_015297 [Aphanomyces euteiches]
MRWTGRGGVPPSHSMLRRALEDSSTGLSSTTVILLAVFGSLVVIGLAVAAYYMNSNLRRRRQDLRREVRRIEATRAVMEQSHQSSYRSARDVVAAGAGHVQLANDVRIDPDFAHTRIPHHELFNLRLVAKGTGTVVFQAIFNNRDIAVKQLLPSQCTSLAVVTDFMREIHLAATLEHPNIVGFVGLAWTDGPSLADLSLLTEFMPNGDLMAFLTYERKTSPADRRLRATWDAWPPPNLTLSKQFSKQRIKTEIQENGTSKSSLALEVADALSYLHSFQPTIIHRDLKSKNILLSSTWNAQLNDFGHSRVMNADEMMTMNVGTIAWIAPEVLSGSRYTEQADIYSFGVLMSELDTLQVPYIELTREYIDEHHSELSSDLHHPKVKAKAKTLSNAFIAMSVAEGKLTPTFTPMIPHELLSLARACLSFAPQDRPTAIELSYRLRSIIQGEAN